MNKLNVTWKHYDKEGKTCDRCGKTGETVRQVVTELKSKLAKHDIDLVYQEEKLKKDAIDQSNLILLNGVPVEQYVPDTRVQYTPCSSCSCLAGADVSCRAISQNGYVSEDVSKGLLIEAIHQAAKGLG
ncbi:DUF2703 domain-containing protein [Candidatus Gottesmanbacteria bacterium]|nr:DUF2703 domain-containing protein [Candidatus Gottesmanbacteria bacterium]